MPKIPSLSNTLPIPQNELEALVDACIRKDNLVVTPIERECLVVVALASECAALARYKMAGQRPSVPVRVSDQPLPSIYVPPRAPTRRRARRPPA